MQCLRSDHELQTGPAEAWADRGGRTNPPSAPPAIPPIVIEPVSRHIPCPTIDPYREPPGPPIVPPRGPDLRM